MAWEGHLPDLRIKEDFHGDKQKLKPEDGQTFSKRDEKAEMHGGQGRSKHKS